MMQRAKKAEKRAARPAFRPGESIFGARSIASPDAEQQKQSGLCGPLCSLNLMDLPVQWHLVQQRQGRVKPTLQAKGMGINDDPELEQEAEWMGEKAARATPSGAFQRNLARPLRELSKARGGGIKELNDLNAWQPLASSTATTAMHIASTAEATGKVVQAAAKKKKKPEPMSLSAFHKNTQAPQKNPSQIWKAQPPTVKMTPPPGAYAVKQSDSGKANEIINIIKEWKQSSHGGCNGKYLTYEEIMQIRGWAEKKKTKNGNLRYSVIFGQGSGSFAGGYQMKIVGLNPLTSSSGVETKGATFHITIDDEFKKIFGYA